MPPKSEKANSFYYKKDRLNQLRGFCAVVQNDCSLIKASEKLGLEKPAISKQISALERDLGIELFDRKGKILKLNENGIELYKEAIDIINSVDKIYNGFASKLENDRNRIIRIAGHYIMLSDILPKYIKQLLSIKKYENLKIELYNISKTEAFDKLKDGKIDIAFYPSNLMDLPPQELVKEDLFCNNFVLAMHKNHPLSSKKEITEEDLINYPYFVLDNYMFYDPSKYFKIKPSNITFKNAILEVVFGLVRENLGMVLCLNEFFERYYINDGIFVKKELPFISEKIYFSLYKRKKSFEKEAIKGLIKIIKNYAN